LSGEIGSGTRQMADEKVKSRTQQEERDDALRAAEGRLSHKEVDACRRVVVFAIGAGSRDD